jgi:probable addiction module antidote protein
MENAMKVEPCVSNEDAIVDELRHDPAFVVEYLKAALEDTEEPRLLLIALRHVVMARGITKVAKKAGIGRQSLYQILSRRGNPRLTTLIAVIKALGFSLALKTTS